MKNTIFLISTDEYILRQEAHDELKQYLQQQGFERQTPLIINQASDWENLNSNLQSPSLFSHKQYLEVYNTNNKFDRNTKEFLATLPQDADYVTIILTGKLSKAEQQSAWFKWLQQHAKINIIWPPKTPELPTWLVQHAKRYQVNLDRAAATYLAQLTEGNLSAAIQALKKLALTFPQQPITQTEIQISINDNARFNVFDLMDECLLGKINKIDMMLNHLQAGNTAPTLISWALAREFRIVSDLLTKLQQGQALQTALNHSLKWRAAYYQRATTRLTLNKLYDLHQQLLQLDQSIKGSLSHNPWLLLQQICCEFAR